jgi:hypothetical protein
VGGDYGGDHVMEWGDYGDDYVMEWGMIMVIIM